MCCLRVVRAMSKAGLLVNVGMFGIKDGGLEMQQRGEALARFRSMWLGEEQPVSADKHFRSGPF